MAAGFNEKVWEKISQIPSGKVSTYKEIARALKSPNAFRAVGNACNKNPNAPRVPCHRVVSNSGKIGGYAFGVKKKIALLAKEGVRVKGGKIADFDIKLFRF
ncbi:MAG TPA: MGMT family protein [archaeon]|nr:MGMT family protein [archaeon]